MISSNTTNITNNTDNEKNYIFPLIVLMSLFFLWGFLTCLNDILIPHLKVVFNLDYAKAMLIQFCFFMAYAIVSIPAGIIIKKIGYKLGIVLGLTTMAVGCFLFYPAAGLRIYYLFLAALFILASGVAVLQVAANPYVNILGKKRTASSRMNLAQAFNSLGTTIAPYIGSIIILGAVLKTADQIAKMTSTEAAAYKIAQARAVQMPYIWLGIILLAVAIFFIIVKLPKIEEETNDKVSTTEADSTKKSVWRHKHLILGAIAIFTYVGAEVSIGSFLVNYLNEPYIGKAFSVKTIGELVALYWGGAMIGRFIGSYAQKRIMPAKVLAFNAIIAAALVVISMLTFNIVAMVTILAVGLFNSVMFPTIFSLSLEGLGKHINQGSGILCTAIVGGAILPLAQGFLADKIGIHHAFILPILCYLYILYFAVKGHIPKKIVTNN